MKDIYRHKNVLETVQKPFKNVQKICTFVKNAKKNTKVVMVYGIITKNVTCSKKRAKRAKVPIYLAKK